MTDSNQKFTIYHQGADRSLVILYVHGADSRDYLQRMVSCDLSRISPEQGSRGTLLDGKGRIVAAFDLLQWSEGFLLVTGQGESVSLKTRLESMVILEDVEIETDSHQWLHLYGEESASALHPLGTPVPGSFLACQCSDQGLLVNRPRFHPSGFDLLVTTEQRDSQASVFAEIAECATDEQRDQGRILLGLPKVGAEIGERTLPPEVGLGDAVAYDKGCYAGQEVLARIRTYGHVNREIRRVEFTDLVGEAEPAVGDDLFPSLNDEKPVGQITSIARTSDGWAAIASMRYKFLKDAGPEEKVIWNRGGNPESIGVLKPVFAPEYGNS